MWCEKILRVPFSRLLFGALYLSKPYIFLPMIWLQKDWIGDSIVARSDSRATQAQTNLTLLKNRTFFGEHKISSFFLCAPYLLWPFHIPIDLNIYSLILIIHSPFSKSHFHLISNFHPRFIFPFTRKRSILSLHFQSNSLPVNVIINIEQFTLLASALYLKANFVPSSYTLSIE